MMRALMRPIMRPFTHGTGGVSVTPAISRTADGSVGQTYTVVGVAAPFNWAWSDGSDISGATNATYVAQAADIGKTLVVEKGGATVATAAGPVLAAPILLWAMDDLTGVTDNITIDPAIDSSLKVQGTGSIKLTGNGVAFGGYIQKTALGTHSAADLDVIAAAVILPDSAEFQNVTSFAIRPQIGASGYVSDSATSRTINDTLSGVIWQAFNTSETALSGVASGQVDARVLVGQSGTTSGSPYAAQPRADALYAKAGGVPTVCITVDDGHPSINTWLMPRLVARGLCATFYLPRANIDTIYCMPLADIIEMRDSGVFSIALDGTRDDGPMTSLADPATVVANYLEDVAWARANGFDTPALWHMCYPNGTIRVAGTKVRDQTVTCNGTTTVTLSATSTTILAGMVVAGYQVPAGTVVVTPPAGTTTVVLNNAIPSQTVPLSFTDTSGVFHTGKLQTALAAAGVRTGRTTNSGVIHSRFGLGGTALVMPGYSGSLATNATMQTWVESAKTKKGTIVAYFHIFDDANGSGLRTVEAEMEGFLDYLTAEKAAGRIAVLTIDQMWARDGGSACP